MQEIRPFVLSIAGFDPTGGAGVIADCKTFEQIGVYGLSIITSNTIQTDSRFLVPNWIDKDQIFMQTRLMLENYDVECVKIGLIESFSLLKDLVLLIKSIKPNIYLIWDPILKSSSGYDFHENNPLDIDFIQNNIDLLTPNLPEFEVLFKNNPVFKSSNRMSVLRKGGHDPEKPGTDVLYISGSSYILEGKSFSGKSKHGTGCVLSAAICSYIALRYTLVDACKSAKEFVEKRILSNDTNLAYYSEIKNS